jgi:NhaB family Na+:H+ antiporter
MTKAENCLQEEMGMPETVGQAFRAGFLGNAPGWYKLTIFAFLVLNPLLLIGCRAFVTGWVLLVEFIFTLAMALSCYPLPSSGLLALQAVLLGLTTPDAVYQEVSANLPVLLLLIFMVAGIYFMQELLQTVFTKILLGIRSKVLLSFLFCATSAFLSAFLDALTVIAVIIAVASGFYNLYHRYLSERSQGAQPKDVVEDASQQQDLQEFRGFLRNLMMHAAVGTALGGVTTVVGEPQNILIATTVKWHFAEFFLRMAPVSMPVLVTGLATCVILEKLRLFGYGYPLPESIRLILVQQTVEHGRERNVRQKVRLLIQGVMGVILILSLAFHVAEIGIIGLMIIVVLTAVNGVTDEHRIGMAFTEALPFTALLVVFFAIVAVIHDQHLFTPVTDAVLQMSGPMQLSSYYLANGVLSMISDNVFVATVYMTQTAEAFASGRISRAQFEGLAIAINTGTNIPSVATPNGQAAFLFLLTSTIAPLIRLSYGRMVLLDLPYTFTMTLMGLLAVWFFL